jgi:selenocysteine lyase/cysteine desulfurase
MRDTVFQTDDPFAAFRQSLSAPGSLRRLRQGLIGEGVPIETPLGTKPLIYADYTASGRALWQVERFMLDRVLPYYANSHTEGSFCGAYVSRLRGAARATIARACGAGDAHAVIFCGAGATAGINRLVALLGAGRGTRVILGPYEHHSNILPWRESGAEVIELNEASGGGPDLSALARALATGPEETRTICAFSAASNVTGVIADVARITCQVKAAGARMVWDYAGGGPYLPIRMRPAPGAEIDAVVLSPHKFAGGPGASGVLILRRDAPVIARPSWPGGGTVRFVSPGGHDYNSELEVREEAGTPNITGDIRAALAFIVKDALGEARIARRNRALLEAGERAWRSHPLIELLAPPDTDRLPVFPFRIRDGAGGHLHHQDVTRLLSDAYGIQARGGCACAGPYVHRLLGIDAASSERTRRAILAGDERAKPGFVRLNLSVLMDATKVNYILDSVIDLAEHALEHADTAP